MKRVRDAIAEVRQRVVSPGGFYAYVAACCLVVGAATSTALGAVNPAWEDIWMAVAFLFGLLVIRPLRQLLTAVAALPLRATAAFVGVVVLAVGAARDVDPKWLDAHWTWIWLGTGVVVASFFSRFVILGLAWPSTMPLDYRVVTSALYWVGAAAAVLAWRSLEPELALPDKWIFRFVAFLLIGIALADTLGAYLGGGVFRRVVWETLVLAGVAAAVAAPVLWAKLNEDERSAWKPTLPVDNGPIAYVRGAAGRAQIVLEDASGRRHVIPSVKNGTRPFWSPDGRRLAFVTGQGETSRIVGFDTLTRATSPLTRTPGDYADPAWSPDGTRIAFTRRGRDGNVDVYAVAVPPAVADPVRVTRHLRADLDPTWSPDGRELAFASNRSGQFDIYVAAADGKRVARLTQGVRFAADDRQPAWSPDGRTIAFVSRAAKSRTADVYLVDADGRKGLKNLTVDLPTDATDPTWSPDGTALAFAGIYQGKRALYRIASLHRLARRDRPKLERLADARQPSFAPAWKPVPLPRLGRGAWRPAWLVRQYAPLVRLHHDEKYRPMGASRFISISTLDWAGCGADQRVADHPVERNLGGGETPGDTSDSYEFDGRTCRRGAGPFSVHGFYRPTERTKEGFVLTPHEDVTGEALTVRRRGSQRDDRPSFVRTTRVPVYFEYVPQRSITYWMFYGYSATDPAGRFGKHEGDWERITVCLDGDEQPIAAVYHRHKVHDHMRWSLVPKFATHPIVYSAKGSHASYTNPGRRPLLQTFDDRNDDGAVWPTWENLRNVFGQPWYGYGGAWGRPPGPEGPSRYKVGDEGC